MEVMDKIIDSDKLKSGAMKVGSGLKEMMSAFHLLPAADPKFTEHPWKWLKNKLSFEPKNTTSDIIVANLVQALVNRIGSGGGLDTINTIIEKLSSGNVSEALEVVTEKFGSNGEGIVGTIAGALGSKSMLETFFEKAVEKSDDSMRKAAMYGYVALLYPIGGEKLVESELNELEEQGKLEAWDINKESLMDFIEAGKVFDVDGKVSEAVKKVFYSFVKTFSGADSFFEKNKDKIKEMSNSDKGNYLMPLFTKVINKISEDSDAPADVKKVAKEFGEKNKDYCFSENSKDSSSSGKEAKKPSGSKSDLDKVDKKSASEMEDKPSTDETKKRKS